MKLKNSIVLLFIFITIKSSGQINHVLNYSFEQYTACGIGNCTDNWVSNWYSPTITSTNWFSYPCDGTMGTIGVPQNFAGYQYARSGQCYAGIDMSESGHVRTYLAGTFSSLDSSKKYCITFYVSLDDSAWFAASAVGAFISNDSVCDESRITALPYTPQIENPATNVITDKINWVSVSGEYFSQGGERFITIGDFYSDTLSHFTIQTYGGAYEWGSEVNAAYFVDDVYVRELTIANAGREDSICAGDSVRIGKDTTTVGVSFSWQPTTGLSNPNIAQPIAAPSVTTTYTLTVINDSIHNCNCADSVTRDSVVISVCTGINGLSSKVSSKIYPDPNNGNFTLSLSKLYNIPITSGNEIEIYDVFGRKVYATKVNPAITEINLGSQLAGMYFYKILSPGNIPLTIGKFTILK